MIAFLTCFRDEQHLKVTVQLVRCHSIPCKVCLLCAQNTQMFPLFDLLRSIGPGRCLIVY